jgi:hypothetical protein
MTSEEVKKTLREAIQNQATQKKEIPDDLFPSLAAKSSGVYIFKCIHLLMLEFQKENAEAEEDLCRDILDRFYGHVKPDLSDLLHREDPSTIARSIIDR